MPSKIISYMLDQIARHGLIDLDVKAKGELHIGAPHTVEVMSIGFGQAVATAIDGKNGIRPFLERNYLKFGFTAARLDAITKAWPSSSSVATSFPLTVPSHSVKLYLT